MVDEAGDYTLVALGYDANGTWQGTQSVAFTVKSPIGKTWRKSFTGDYTYGEVAYEGVDKGLTLYTCDEDASVFTIAPWAGGGSLKFQLDEDGKTVHVFNSYTGEDYKEGAPIYAGDANALLGDEYEASYYDAATKTYHFNVVYFVPGLGAMGKDKATDYWKAHSDEFDMILLTDDEKLYVSEGIKDSFTSDREFEIVEK